MKRRKFSAWSLALLCLLLASPLLNFEMKPARTSSTFTVTETSTEFIVENDYYIAHIPTTPAIMGAGTINKFYVKPQTSVNIVSHTGGFRSLIGAEYIEYNGTSSWGYSVWSSLGISSLNVSKVYDASNLVTIRSEIIYRTAVYSKASNSTLIIYITFYDQPYYLVTLTRIQEDNYAQIYNSQICFLYDNDEFWDKDYNTHYACNRSGHAVQGYVSGSYLNEASIYGKMPWLWVYNTTLGIGHGTVLLDAYPRPMEAYLGMVAGGRAGFYSEYQIDLALYAER